MKSNFSLLLFVFAFLTPTLGLAQLEYDSKANNIQLYGPYVKYNILKEPYSVGRFQFSLDDIGMDLVYEKPNITDVSLSPETESGNEKELKIYVIWPKFLLQFGEIKIFNKAGRQLINESFRLKDIGDYDAKYARFHLEDEDEGLLETLKEPFQICVRQEFESSLVKACSNWIQFDGKKFNNSFKGKNLAAVKLNGKKTPKNSQISLSQNMKNVQLHLYFKSGFTIYVKDKVHLLDTDNVVIDTKEKRIGIVTGDGSVQPTQLTIKDRFFSFIKENNYFKNKYTGSAEWPENLEDAEMEFAPFQSGASIQLYGMILPKVPPPTQFKLNDDIPIATYSDHIELKGTKASEEVLAARVKNELFIHENGTEFLWNFPTPKAGEINQNYISLQHKGRDYYFSKRIFRAHQTTVSGALAISTSPTLDLVPGYNFSAEHWFEEIWGKSSWSQQRWGLSANLYETAQAFSPKEGFPEKISINPTNFDVLYRLSKGVRPVQSSFGLGLRYLNFNLFRTINDNIQTRFLGVGGFWHTAPQKIVDDIFNIVPFFRYPKWMEISLFYYPLLLGPEQLGFSFSWQAKGKLFFAKQWYLEASFNVNSISFKKEKVTGVTIGADSFGITTAHGTIGIGYLFN